MDSATLYLLVKALHIIAVIAWMAGLLYLPRLYVYHVDAEPSSIQSETFKVMERRLLQVITTPAMLATWVLGLTILFGFGVVDMSTDIWFHIKLALVVALSAFHMALAKWRKDFAEGRNTRPARFYRAMNEVPTVLMVVIVILAVVKPL